MGYGRYVRATPPPIVSSGPPPPIVSSGPPPPIGSSGPPPPIGSSGPPPPIGSSGPPPPIGGLPVPGLPLGGLKPTLKKRDDRSAAEVAYDNLVRDLKTAGAFDAAEAALTDLRKAQSVSTGSNGKPIENPLSFIDVQFVHGITALGNALSLAQAAEMRWVAMNKKSPQDPKTRPPAITTPFMRIADLYVSLTFTGQGTWPGIVYQRCNSSDNDTADTFTVFTGTHGNLGGQVLDEAGKWWDTGYREMFADQFYGQDRGIADGLERELGCNIKVVDIWDQRKPLVHPAVLKKAVGDELADGRVVIMAWCYSVEGFKQAPEFVRKHTRTLGESDLEFEKRESDRLAEEGEYVKKRGLVPLKDVVTDVFGVDPSAYKRTT